MEIAYTVPIKERSKTSLIKFLPVTEEDVNSRINKGLFAKNIKVRDFSVKFLEKDEREDVVYREKARVFYRLDFNELSQLDGILLGSLFVQKKGNSISIKREFKSVSMSPPNPTPGEKKIFTESMRLLKDGYVHFRVIFPIAAECRSNKGEISLGLLSYKFPLTDTVEKIGNNLWNYSITTAY
ncbi:MAG: hypothetical protein HS129_01570 [Leptospiraceae bacterium]|nr:hypothetical protein [Leptospiraceae bacterium]